MVVYYLHRVDEPMFVNIYVARKRDIRSAIYKQHPWFPNVCGPKRGEETASGVEWNAQDVCQEEQGQDSCKAPAAGAGGRGGGAITPFCSRYKRL